MNAIKIAFSLVGECVETICKLLNYFFSNQIINVIQEYLVKFSTKSNQLKIWYLFGKVNFNHELKLFQVNSHYYSI